MDLENNTEKNECVNRTLLQMGCIVVWTWLAGPINSQFSEHLSSAGSNQCARNLFHIKDKDKDKDKDNLNVHFVTSKVLVHTLKPRFLLH